MVIITGVLSLGDHIIKVNFENKVFAKSKNAPLIASNVIATLKNIGTKYVQNR